MNIIRSFRCCIAALAFIAVAKFSWSQIARFPKSAVPSDDLRRFATEKLANEETERVAPAPMEVKHFASLNLPAASVSSAPILQPTKPIKEESLAPRLTAQGRFQSFDDVSKLVTAYGAFDLPGQKLPKDSPLSALSVICKAEPNADGSFQIVDMQPEMLAQLSFAVERTSTGPAKSKLTNAVQTLRRHLAAAPSASGAKAQQEFAEGIKQSQDECIDAFLAMSPAERDQQAPDLGAFFMEARATRGRLHDKGIYGTDDQYSPPTYMQIFEHCSSVARLSLDGQTIGTTFLIGEDVVLTAGHCLVNEAGDAVAPTAFHVIFERGPAEQMQRYEYSVTRLVIQGNQSNTGGIKVQKLDFAVLKLGANVMTGLSVKKEGFTPLPIAARQPELVRDRTVYVVGFPGGSNKIVADYARVFVPFNNSERTHAGFQLELEGELKAARDRAERVPDLNQQQLQRLMAATMTTELRKKFADSFQWVRDQQTREKRFFYVSAMLAEGPIHPPQPAIALDSDTFHGDSGAPVFARSNSEVIALFIRGAPDRKDLRLGWEEHEEAIPIHYILDSWEAERKGEPASFGIML